MFEIKNLDPAEIQKWREESKGGRKCAHYIPFDQLEVNQCVTVPDKLVSVGNCRIRAMRQSINGKVFKAHKEGKNTVIYRFK